MQCNVRQCESVYKWSGGPLFAKCLYLCLTGSLLLLLREGTFIQPATSNTNPWWCYMTADGKWHPAANPPISSAFPRPPRNASPRIPPVCLWRASRQADGASRHHCRGQGGGQVCHGCLWLWFVRNQLGCYPVLFSFPLLLTDMGSLKSSWRRAFLLSKCRPFSL